MPMPRVGAHALTMLLHIQQFTDIDGKRVEIDRRDGLNAYRGRRALKRWLSAVEATDAGAISEFGEHHRHAGRLIAVGPTRRLVA